MHLASVLTQIFIDRSIQQCQDYRSSLSQFTPESALGVQNRRSHNRRTALHYSPYTHTIVASFRKVSHASNTFDQPRGGCRFTRTGSTQEHNVFSSSLRAISAIAVGWSPDGLYSLTTSNGATRRWTSGRCPIAGTGILAGVLGSVLILQA